MHVARNTDRLSEWQADIRTVRTGRETDDHEQCGQADEQGGQVEIEIDEQCGQADR